MKVVHVVTSLVGGAGIAAVRLHSALLEQGVESYILTKDKPLNENHKNIIHCRPSFSFLKSPIFYIKRKVLDRIIRLDLIRSRQVEIFTVDWVYGDIANHDIFKEVDIVNLHWISHFVDYSSFFGRIKKPIVWTLHDMNPFLGGLHYSFELLRFPELKGPNLFIQRRKERILRNRNISVVCLSEWMRTECLQVDVLRKCPHFLIRNGVPEQQVLSDFERLNLKLKYGLTQGKKIISFVSESLDNYRKGCDVIIDAIESNKLSNFEFVVIGRLKGLDMPANIKALGYLDEREIFNVLQISDALIITSRQDNLPNVMLESLVCGTPVIASPVGGMRDIIDSENGVLLEDCTSDALIVALKKFNSSTFDRSIIRRKAIAKFSLFRQAESYIDLYSSLLSKAKCD